MTLHIREQATAKRRENSASGEPTEKEKSEVNQNKTDCNDTSRYTGQMERKQTASEVTARLIGAASLLRKGTYYEKACASTSRRGVEIFQGPSGSAAEAAY